MQKDEFLMVLEDLDAAGYKNRKLKTYTFKTIVHGDAKLENFCFSEDGNRVAAVDFQYVGGGCGMKDIHHKNVDFEELEREWRELFPVAWTDFYRFLKGWAPGLYESSYSKGIARKIIDRLK